MSPTQAIDLFAEFATDKSAEQDGVWEPYAGDIEFLIAREGNPAYNRMITALVRKHKRLLDSKTEAADAKSEELMIETLAKTILLGWRGTFLWKGKPMGDYTVEKAKEMLAVKDFKAWVTSVAADQARYKVQEDQEAEGK